MFDRSGAGQGGDAAWRSAVARVSEGRSPEALARQSRDGFPIGPLYRKPDRVAPQPWRSMVEPVAVFQPIDDDDPARAADLIRSDVEGGASGVTVVLAGSAFSRSFGLALDGLENVLDAIDIATTALRIEVPAMPAEGTLDRVLRAMEAGGIPVDHPRLDLAADPLSMAAPGEAVRWVTRLREHGIATAALRADGRAHHEAGASAGQELAAVLSAGVFALRALEQAGLEGVGDPVRFTLVADMDLTVTVAKFRALRRLWARVRAACGDAPAPVALHGETAWRMLARRDAWTNVPRNTVACAGAILGGADTVTVLPFTSAIGLPDAFARRLARNTPLVLLEEAALGRVADPCAGAGAFEAITEALCMQAWRLFQDLERAGGLCDAMASGTWAATLAATAAARHAELAEGRATLVGVTAFRSAEAAPPAVVRPASLGCGGGRPPPALPSRREAEEFEGASASAAGEANA